MARRILFVEQTFSFRDPEKELFVDAWVEVDWKIRMAVDQWTGDVETAPPTYRVRPIEPDPSEMNSYGVISEPEEVDWLAQAMTKPRDDHSYKAKKIIARVSQLGVKGPEGKRGFTIEVLTGVDAERFVTAEKSIEIINLIGKHWWKIGIGTAVFWWWLFIRDTG